MAFHLVSLYKAPNFLPVDIGVIIFCLFAKCVLLITGDTAIELCGNLNLCAGLGAKIEGYVHNTPSEYSSL